MVEVVIEIYSHKHSWGKKDKGGFIVVAAVVVGGGDCVVNVVAAALVLVEVVWLVGCCWSVCFCFCFCFVVVFPFIQWIPTGAQVIHSLAQGVKQ